MRGCPSRSYCGGQYGHTALIAAAREEHIEAVKALLEAGAKKNLQDKVSLLLPPSCPSPSLSPSLPPSFAPSVLEVSRCYGRRGVCEGGAAHAPPAGGRAKTLP